MKNSVQSIERAFEILRVVHDHVDGVAVGNVASVTGLHTSTTSRIVATLEHVGALARQENKLFIGQAIVQLATGAPWRERLIQVATPLLRQIAADTREAVGLTYIDGEECVVFYQIPSSHHIQIRDWTGERFPLHVTSTGKLYLAQLSEAERAEVAERPLLSIAPQTKTEFADLEAEFVTIRQEQVAWTEDELEDGLTSVAAAINGNNGRFLAGLYISLPNYRVEDKADLAEQVRTTAANIAAELAAVSA